MQVHSIAYKFIINNKIKNFSIDLDKLIKIVKNNGWEIFSFKQNLSLIKELNLGEKVKNTLGFTYTFKTMLDDNKILIKNIIFYKDELTLKEKYFVILHEVGHIILSHTNNTSYLEKSLYLNSTSLELEADLFACEVLAPSCILNKLNLANFNDINKYTLIPDKYINQYLLEIHKMNSTHKDKLDTQVKNLYIRYIIRFKIEHMKITRILIIAVLLLCIPLFFLLYNKISDEYLSSKDPILEYVIENNLKIFVTATGQKYHKEDCVHLKNSNPIYIPHQDLKNSHYTPCKLCFNPSDFDS